MSSQMPCLQYPRVYPFSTMFTYFVTVPHSVMVVLAYGAANAKQGEAPWVVHKAEVSTLLVSHHVACSVASTSMLLMLATSAHICFGNALRRLVARR